MHMRDSGRAVSGWSLYSVLGRSVVSAKTALPPEAEACVLVPALLSVATAARLLDCSSRTVRRRIAEGSLPAVTDHGRVMVRGDDLRKYIDDLERIGPRRARP